MTQETETYKLPGPPFFIYELGNKFKIISSIEEYGSGNSSRAGKF